jgi:hypothetical protein
VCPRHHQAAPDPRLTSPIQTWTAPELTAVHYAHQRLQRHPRAATALTTARAISTRWYDHQQHLTPAGTAAWASSARPTLTWPRREAPPPHSWRATW